LKEAVLYVAKTNRVHTEQHNTTWYELPFMFVGVLEAKGRKVKNYAAIQQLCWMKVIG
jgi:hypothetical protein